MLVGLHLIAAGKTGIPELAIRPEDGDDLAKAAQKVMRHYSVETTQKTLDWIALFGTLGAVYGTRAGAYIVRTRAEKEARRGGAPGNVVPFATAANVQQPRPAPQPAPPPMPQGGMVSQPAAQQAPNQPYVPSVPGGPMDHFEG